MAGDQRSVGERAGRALHRRIKRTSTALAALVLIACTSGLVSVGALVFVVTSGQSVIDEHARNALDVERLDMLSQQESSALRGLLLTQADHVETRVDTARAELDAHVRSLARRVGHDALTVRRFETIEEAIRARRRAADETLLLVPTNPEGALALFEREVMPLQMRLNDEIRALNDQEREELADARMALRNGALIAIAGVLVGALTELIFGLILAARLRTTTEEATNNLNLLEQANRDLDAFSGRVAHDLRAILAPVKLSLPALAASDDAKVGRAGERIDRSVERMVALIEALLLFARAGREAASGSAFVSETVSAALESVAPLTTEVGAEIVVEECRAEVRCSAPLLFQVFVNLFSNSLKHLRGRDEKKISVACAMDEECVRIDVVDTGPGVPRETLGSLGRPFFRVPTDRTPGTGIGLATVCRIIEAAGGRVRFESEPDKGMRVHLVLPRAMEEERELQRVPAPMRQRPA